MKTKLLRKVRKRFQIVKYNGNTYLIDSGKLTATRQWSFNTALQNAIILTIGSIRYNQLCRIRDISRREHRKYFMFNVLNAAK